MTPTPEAQLVFLSKLQRIFAESDFAATYKFALLISIAELAVEKGFDDKESLFLSNSELAHKFIELYWQQTAPYSSGGREPAVLIQNNGQQAAVINSIVEFRRIHSATTPQAARSIAGYRALVSRVALTVSAQPVKYLQNFGGSTDTFLYLRSLGGIALQPGIAYCLRRFQPLVQQLSRNSWISHIKRNQRNSHILVENDDLGEFLFDTSRDELVTIGKGLRKLSNGQCFYCDRQVSDADVDHFIPFSLYPRDLAHNFVFAHRGCNQSKSDTLAGKRHLERWANYIARHDGSLCEIGASAGRVSNLNSSRSVARWAYQNGVSGGAQAWLEARSYEPIGTEFLDYLY